MENFSKRLLNKLVNLKKTSRERTDDIKMRNFLKKVD